MNHKPIYNRLRRIEGQIRGIEEMLAKERPDTDILIQLEAAKSSLSSTCANFIEGMLEKKDDEVKISETALRAILRSIKKS
jgi:CsoR family transcriptional regulator, copper-sensing transcriptional repressor